MTPAVAGHQYAFVLIICALPGGSDFNVGADARSGAYVIQTYRIASKAQNLDPALEYS